MAQSGPIPGRRNEAGSVEDATAEARRFNLEAFRRLSSGLWRFEPSEGEVARHDGRTTASRGACRSALRGRPPQRQCRRLKTVDLT